MSKNRRKNKYPTRTNQRTLAIRQGSFSGPLPHPDTLREYNEILPGAAERLLAKFEEQSDHRRSMESRALNANMIQSFLGQLFGFTLLGGLVFAGAYLISQGSDLTGFGTIATAVGGGLYIFTRARTSRQNELEGKRRG